MKLLNTYESQEEAEIALSSISGNKRLASERDGTETVYNLFGVGSWGNFYKLDLLGLRELEVIIEKKGQGEQFDSDRYKEIITMLKYISNNFDLNIPKHWL